MDVVHTALRRRARFVLLLAAVRLVAVLLWALGPGPVVQGAGILGAVAASFALGVLYGNASAPMSELGPLAVAAELPVRATVWTIRVLEIACAAGAVFLAVRYLR